MKKIVLSFTVLAFITANAQTNFKVGDITYKVKNATQVELNTKEKPQRLLFLPRLNMRVFLTMSNRLVRRLLNGQA